MKTLKQIITSLNQIVSSNELYKSFGEGNIWEMDTKVQKYPMIWVDAETNNHLINNSSVIYNIDVWFIDLIYNDESNELNIKSDTMQSAIDLTIYLKENMGVLDFYVKDGNYSATVFTEKWTDKVSGTKLTLNLTVKGAGSTCKNIYSL